jgi:hypothetical protein
VVVMFAGCNFGSNDLTCSSSPIRTTEQATPAAIQGAASKGNRLMIFACLVSLRLISLLSPEDPSCLLFQASKLHIYCFRLPPRHSCHCVAGTRSAI